MESKFDEIFEKNIFEDENENKEFIGKIKTVNAALCLSLEIFLSLFFKKIYLFI